MSELVRCKPCGYVIRQDRLRAVCPACGAPSSAFEPFEDRVSARSCCIFGWLSGTCQEV